MKKLLLALLCCMCFNVISVNAQNHGGIEPFAMGIECPSCGGLAIESLISTTYSEPMDEECIHGKSGYDSVRHKFTFLVSSSASFSHSEV